MHKINIQPFLYSRQTFLVAGTLLLAVSPFLSCALYSAAALVTLFDCRKEIFNSKERVTIVSLIFVISVWMIFRKISPENVDPGAIALSDYSPFYFFLFFLSLKPFTNSESEKFSYALTLTVPQHFLLALGEKYMGWHGGISFPKGKIHILDIFVGAFDGNAAMTAGFYNRNLLGLYGVICVAVSLSLFLNEIKKMKELGLIKTNSVLRITWTALSLVLSIVLLAWTESRNGWFAFIFVITAFLWLGRRILILKIAAIILPALTVLAMSNPGKLSKFARFLIPGSLGSRLSSTNAFFDVFSGERGDIYHCAVQLISEKPITGWGIGAFQSECSSRIGHRVSHAHNIALQLGTDIGIPVALLVICLIGYFIGRSIYRFAKPWDCQYGNDILSKGLLVAAVAVILMQVFDLALFMTYRLNFLFWIALAIPYSRAVYKRSAQTF